jgi:hypothetical protein
MTLPPPKKLYRHGTKGIDSGAAMLYMALVFGSPPQKA